MHEMMNEYCGALAEPSQRFASSPLCGWKVLGIIKIGQHCCGLTLKQGVVYAAHGERSIECIAT